MLALAGAANAASITGDLLVTGRASLPVGSTPETATTINFGGVLDSIGTINGSAVAWSSISYTRSLTFEPTFKGPQDIWWSTAIPGLKFELTSVTQVLRSDDGLMFTVSGTGFLSADGYDKTASRFSLTYNTASGVQGYFTAGNAAVPIPAAGWLFGSAIFGAATVARRRASRKSSESAAA